MKNIKSIITAICIVLFISNSAYAQRHERPDFEKIKAEKIAFFSKTLELTPAEAEKFWPVYNEMEKKKFEIMDKRREFEKVFEKGLQNMSEAEYTELSRKITAINLEDGKLSVEYNELFLKILPAKKVVQLYNAEMQFRHQLLRSYRDNDKK